MPPVLLNPSRFGSGGGGGFHPTDVSGLLLWLSTQAITGMTDAQAFAGSATWADLSGLGNHAVCNAQSAAPKYRTASGPSSGPCVEFQATGSASSTGYFDLPATFLSGSGATALEVFIGFKATTSTESGAPIILNASNDAGFFPYSDGKIYETIGTTVRKNSITPGLALNAWRRYNAWSAASDYSIRLDETSQYATSTNTVDIAIGSDTPPKLGAAKKLPVSPLRFVGSLAYVLVYSKKLSGAERGDVESFLIANPSGGTP